MKGKQMPTPQERGNQIASQLRATEAVAATIGNEDLDMALARLHRLLALGAVEIGLDWDQLTIQSGGTPKTKPEP